MASGMDVEQSRCEVLYQDLSCLFVSAGCGWIGECADSGIMWLDLMQHNSLMWSRETWIIATVQQGLRDHGWDCGHRAVRSVYRKTQRVINSSVGRFKFSALNSALKNSHNALLKGKDHPKKVSHYLLTPHADVKSGEVFISAATPKKNWRRRENKQPTKTENGSRQIVLKFWIDVKRCYLHLTDSDALSYRDFNLKRRKSRIKTFSLLLFFKF